MHRLILCVLTGLTVVFLPQYLLAEDPAGPPGPPQVQPAGPESEYLFFPTLRSTSRADVEQALAQLQDPAQGSADAKEKPTEMPGPPFGRQGGQRGWMGGQGFGGSGPGRGRIGGPQFGPRFGDPGVRPPYTGGPTFQGPYSGPSGPKDIKSPNFRVFFLHFVTPEDILPNIRQLCDIPSDKNETADGSLKLGVDIENKALLAYGSPEKLNRLDSILKVVSGPKAGADGPEEPVQVEVYPVNKTDPQTTLKVMQTLLAGKPDVRMDIDPKTNNLIVLARPAEHATIRAVLDQMQHDTRQVAVIRLKIVDSQTAILLINKLFDGGDASKGGTSGAPQVDADPRTQQLMIRGTLAQIEQVKSLLQKMGETIESVTVMPGPPFSGRGEQRGWMAGQGFGGPGRGAGWMAGHGFGGPGMGPGRMGGPPFGRGGPDGGPPQMAGPNFPGPNAGPHWMGGSPFNEPGGRPWAGPGYGPQHHWAAFGPMQQPPWQQQGPYGRPNRPWQQYEPYGRPNQPWMAFGAGPHHPWPNGQNWYQRLLAYNLRPHHPWKAYGAGPQRPWRQYGPYGRPNNPWQVNFGKPARPGMAPWMAYGTGPQRPWPPYAQNWYQRLLSYNQRPLRPGFNLKALFERLDTNHDNQLSFEEFSQGMKHLLHAVLPGPGPQWARPVGRFGGQGFGPPARDIPE